MTDAVDRFWDQVDKTGACWRWTGNITAKGYGSFSAIHETIRFWRAHRFSWHINRGPIPDGHHVLHRCDNPWCVNPNHLWIGTNADNHNDKIRKGRQSKGIVVNTAKLTPEQVRAIRSSSLNNSELARRYGMHNSTISRIRNMQYWKSVQ